jgi:hypothetical protein
MDRLVKALATVEKKLKENNSLGMNPDKCKVNHKKQGAKSAL